jgi:hypothetical protein
MTLWLQTYTLQISLGIIALIATVILVLVAYKVKVCFRENPAEVISG